MQRSLLRPEWCALSSGSEAAPGWLAWPPRLPEQPIFYPVLNEWYAAKIARKWNPPHAGVGLEGEFDAHIVGGIRMIAMYDAVGD